MGKYTCERCGVYTTDSRQNFWTHQNKTKKCGRPRDSGRLRNDFERLQKNSIRLQSEHLGMTNPKECEYCHKVFSRVNNKNYHIKHRCKVKKEQDRQRLEQTHSAQTINNTTNNTTNNIQNIQNNNITVVVQQQPLLNAFLKQNMNILDKQREIENFIHKNLDHIEGGEKNCLENTDTALKGFIMLVQMMFFDPGHPENHMIKAKAKSKDAQVFNGERFIDRQKTNAFMQVADIAFAMIDNSIKYGMLDDPEGDRFAAFNRINNYNNLKRLWRSGSKAQRKRIYNAIDTQLKNRTPPPETIAGKIIQDAKRFKDYKRCLEERESRLQIRDTEYEEETSEFDSGTDISIDL
jgi:hypothetical protein